MSRLTVIAICFTVFVLILSMSLRSVAKSAQHQGQVLGASIDASY